MKSLLKYPGSKWRIAKWIIDHFPDDYIKMTYVEPFFGSGAVFFNKKRSKLEIINDLHKRVVNFFTVVRNHTDILSYLIQHTPWSRDEYNLSYIISDDPIEDARRFLVRMWQGIGSKTSDISGWSNNIKPLDTGVSRWVKLTPCIIETSERLNGKNGKMVQIENKDALEVIKKYDEEYCLMYIDPPYLLRNRNKRIYKHEMNNDDHQELLDTIKDMKARIIISGYDDEMYNKTLEGWYKDTIDARCEFGKEAKEVIWFNYKVESKQMSLF